MTKREALKLHNGDEVIDKVTGDALRVVDRYVSVNGKRVVIEVVTRHNTYSVVNHLDVR